MGAIHIRLSLSRNGSDVVCRREVRGGLRRPDGKCQCQVGIRQWHWGYSSSNFLALDKWQPRNMPDGVGIGWVSRQPFGQSKAGRPNLTDDGVICNYSATRRPSGNDIVCDFDSRLTWWWENSRYEAST